ncbi:hypothetical protein ABPG75_012269 [Micractinium tetrahymenae]
MPSSPVELRVGSTGAGLFVGCGAGVGIVTPIALHSIPLLGQLASSLSASLGSLNHASGGLFSAARGRLRGLGARGLDMGFGCGVMLGYGYGAGVYLKPTALQSLAQAAQAAGQRVLGALPQPVQAAVQQRAQQQQQAQQLGGLGGSWQDPPLQPGGGLLPGASLAATPEHQQPQHSASDGSTNSSGSQPSQQRPQSARDAEEAIQELTKLVLRQQNRLGELEQQVGELQAAVCRLDASAPGCKQRA